MIKLQFIFIIPIQRILNNLKQKTFMQQILGNSKIININRRVGITNNKLDICMLTYNLIYDS